MPTQLFSVGDRVVYRDPKNPRNPLAGEVVDVTEQAVSVRYDAYATGRPGVIAVEHVPDVLLSEHVDAVTPVPLARDYWLPGAGA